MSKDVLRASAALDSIRSIQNRAILVGMLALVAGVVAFAPWLLLWSVGAITGFYVPITFKTWVAAWVFIFLIRGG